MPPSFVVPEGTVSAGVEEGTGTLSDRSRKFLRQMAQQYAENPIRNAVIGGIAGGLETSMLFGEFKPLHAAVLAYLNTWGYVGYQAMRARKRL